MRPAFAFIFLTVVLDMLALGIMVPVLPKLIVGFEGGDHAKAAQITGYFALAWALMQFLASPILGSLSDRFGRRPVLLLSSLGLGLDYIFMALAPNLTWLFVGRLVSGITAATFATASAYIADITPPEERAGRFGMLGAAFGLGFIIGPAVGGWLGQVDLRLPFWVAAGFSLLNTLYGFFVLPESLPDERRAPFQWKTAHPWGARRFVASRLGCAAFAYFLAHESLPSMFVLYTDYKFHWSEATVGSVLAAVGVSSMVVSAWLTSRVVKRLGERHTLFAGLVFGITGFACYGLAQKSWTFLLGVPLIGLWGLTSPALNALLSQKVAPTEQGQLQGALSSLRGVSGMLGPLLFTQSFALATTHGGPAGAPYLLASGLLVLALLLAL
jgi:DHA1 family tetracycline resistance protein-like MFS transporter